MSVLGLDYGRKYIGLSISDGPLAEPLKIIHWQGNWAKLISSLSHILESNKVEKIIVGLPEGQMGEEVKEFAGKIRQVFSLETIAADETLTSQEAAEKLGQENSSRTRRYRRRLDALAATLILQSWLDKKTENLA